MTLTDGYVLICLFQAFKECFSPDHKPGFLTNPASGGMDKKVLDDLEVDLGNPDESVIVRFRYE